MVENKRLPEDFLSTADDLDNIAQKYKDEIRNQTVSNIKFHNVPSNLCRLMR